MALLDEILAARTDEGSTQMEKRVRGLEEQVSAQGLALVALSAALGNANVDLGREIIKNLLSAATAAQDQAPGVARELQLLAAVLASGEPRAAEH